MRRLTALLLALCLALGLAGCGGDAPGPDESAAPSPTPFTDPVPTADPEPARFSLAYDPNASLDPIWGASQVNRELIGLVYEGLYELNNQFQPQPVLCKSSQVSGDGLTWTFALADGALFSDGTPLTAAQAAASLEAARTSPVYSARLAGIAAVAAGEDGSLTVTLSAPNGKLPALLDVPIVLEREGAVPLGTGRYRFETGGDGALQLGRNPCRSAALPYESIPLTPVTSADERASAFNTGLVSLVTTDLTGAYTLGYTASCETVDYPTTDLVYVGFKTTDGPCQSAAVRQAVARALDRDELVRMLLAGHGTAASLPVSPLSADYDAAGAALLDYDDAVAAAKLDEAGWYLDRENGLRYDRGQQLTLTLLVNSDSKTKQAVAARLAEELGRLGVTVTVNTLAWAEYLSALSAGGFDLYIGETILPGDFDPSVLLTGGLSYGGRPSGELAALLAAWKAAWGEERPAAASKLWQQFAQEVPFAPLCFKSGSTLIHWGMASNLQPTRANAFYRMEEWAVNHQTESTNENGE